MNNNFTSGIDFKLGSMDLPFSKIVGYKVFMELTNEHIRKNNLSINVHLELSSNRAIKRAVEDGIGVALISRKVANEEIRNKRLCAIPLSDPSMTRKFYMVHHKDKYLSESLQSFIEMVFKWSADYMQTL